MYFSKDIIDEVIDERIKKIQEKRIKTEKDKNIRHSDGSSDGMSNLQRYIRKVNNKDN